MAEQTFGSLAAQQDTELLKYFHKTAFIQKLLQTDPSKGPFLLLSRPGAGKTALKIWLLSKESPYVAIPLSADRQRVFMDDPNFSDEDYRTILRAELFSGILDELINRKPKFPKKLTKQQKALKEKYTKAEECISEGWLDAATSFITKKFSGMQILGCGFTLNKGKRRQYLAKIRENDVANHALSVLKALIPAEQRDFCLVVDNPEYIVGQGNDLTDRSNAIRIGALLNVLSEIYDTGLRVIAFTKFHIFESVQKNYTDYSQFANCHSRLKWTEDDLLQFLKLRVEKRLEKKWHSVFDITQKNFCNNIFPRLVNGPRDLLFLLRQAHDESSAEKLSESDLLNTVTQLRDEKYMEMSRLLGGVYPGVDAFCNAAMSVVRAITSPLSMNAIDEAINASISDPNSPLNGIRGQCPWVVNVLAHSPRASTILGTLGALAFRENGRIHYPWEGHPLESLDTSESVEISPLFNS